MMLQSLDEDEKVKLNNTYFENRTGGKGTFFLKEDGINEILNKTNLASSDYWLEGTYKDPTGRTLREYQVTKKVARYQ